MAVKKSFPVQQLDAAVEAAMGLGDERLSSTRERAREMTAGGHRRAARDRARNRAMFDLPEDLEKLLDRVAVELSVPRSQVATVLMIYGARSTGLEELKAARRASRSMRFEYVLEIPEIPRGLKK